MGGGGFVGSGFLSIRMTSFFRPWVLLLSNLLTLEELRFKLFFVLFVALFCFVKLIKLFKVVVGDSALGLVVCLFIVGGGIGGTAADSVAASF